MALPSGEEASVFETTKTGVEDYQYGNVVAKEDGTLALKAVQNEDYDPNYVDDNVGPFFLPGQFVGDFTDGFRPWTAAVTLYLDPALVHFKVTSAFNGKDGNYLAEAQLMFDGDMENAAVTASILNGVLYSGAPSYSDALSAGWYTVGVRYYAQGGTLWARGFVLDEQGATVAEWVQDTLFSIDLIGSPRYLWVTSISDPNFELLAKAVIITYDALHISMPYSILALGDKPLCLPSSVDDVGITWSCDRPDIVNVFNGVVSVPEYSGSGDTMIPVNLTASFVLNGKPYTQTYTLWAEQWTESV
jgi:hypothetical protein